jgi:phosphate transport system ATP-binding protein
MDGLIEDTSAAGTPIGVGAARSRPAGPLNTQKISIKNLDFYYGDTRAQKNVTLNLPENQVTGMMGPSGCGKSTLLRVYKPNVRFVSGATRDR